MPMPRSALSATPLRDLDLAVVAGRWPADLTGEVFLSASGQDEAPVHAFFGDGHLVRLSLRPGTFGAAGDRFAWRARRLDTPSARLRDARPEVFVAGAMGTHSPFGASNASNTAPLPWGDRLFTTWDAGRPVEVDPVSLSFVAEVGHRDDWRPAFDHPVLPMVLSTAHPVIDPERDCLWTVALDPIRGSVDVLRYDGEGAHVQRWPVLDGHAPQSMHTVAQTRDWLILVDCAFRADPAEVLGTGERTVTNFSDEPAYVIRKDLLEATPPGEAVAATAFRVGPEVMHYYAAYDDADGLRLIFEHTVDTDLAYAMRADDVDALGRPADPRLRGMYNHPMHAGVVTVLDLDPETGVWKEHASFSDGDRFWGTQLSAQDWSLEGQTRPTLHHLTFMGFRPEVISQRAIAAYADRIDAAGGLPEEETPGALASFDRDTLALTASYEYGLDDYPTSPCFVPRDPAGAASSETSRYAGAEPGGHDGYLVVPVLNDAGFRIDVFAADAVDAGPVAVLAPPGADTVPFLLHSAWMPRAVPAPDVERLRFADELDDARLAALPDDLATVARQVAADLA